jgi:hypothetical protein
MNSSYSNTYLAEHAVVLDKNEFITTLGNELNPVQLKSLILSVKYGMLQYIDNRKNKEHISGQLIRQNGGACLAFTIRKTVIHYDISRSELLESLEKAKNISESKN